MKSRDALPRLVAEYQMQEGAVIIAGPNGSGRSWLLEQVGQLRAQSEPVVAVDCGDADADARIGATPPDTVLLLDGLERATLPVLRALAEHREAGGVGVGTLDTSNHRSPFAEAIPQLIDELELARRVIGDVRQVPLPAMTDDEIERLLHERARTALDAATAHAVVSLAEGRPGWALDLLALAQVGGLEVVPRPGIRPLPRDEARLPAMRSLRRAVGPLTREATASAIALSESGSLDLRGAEDLVGAPVVQVLLERGVLLETASHELFAVPPFVGAALRSVAPRELVDDVRSRIARRLVGHVQLGLPLSEADVLLCAGSLAPPSPSAPAGHDPAPPIEAEILHRAAGTLASFGGEGAARTLLLRAGGFEEVGDPLHRVEMLSALVSPAAGIDALDAVTVSAVDEHLPTAFLEAVLRAEELQSASGDSPAPAAAVGADTDYVLQLWNTTAPVLDTPRLEEIAGGTGGPEDARLARALVDLEAVWNGRLPGESWLGTGARIPLPREREDRRLRHVEATIAIAQALCALLSGECGPRRQELRAVFARVSPGAFHLRWLRHLDGAAVALACGRLDRARLEWRAVVRHAPRFLPIRLRGYLRAIGHALVPDALEGVRAAEPQTADASAMRRFVAYVGGRHDQLLLLGGAEADDSRVLPVARLAKTHLSAIDNHRNPAELLRVADRLRDLELWAPAAHALAAARAVYLSRRASGGVRRCDQRIDALERRIGEAVPWFRPGDLPAHRHPQLTPREREAAALASEGLSNREIAERLGCSARTVESHLGQARAKLGASSRRDLAELLARSA